MRGGADPARSEKKIDPVDGIPAVVRIGAFKREWARGREERRRRQEESLWDTDELSVRRLVERVNRHLERRHIPIHLVLIRDVNGYAIDVYDCTGNQQCTLVGDVLIDLSELPILLKNLEQETGILLDTVS